MRLRNRFWTGIVIAATVLPALLSGRPAAAEEPGRGSAERELIGGLRTNAPDTSDPEFLRVAGFFQIGAGFLSGQARRDTRTTRGTQLSFGTDLDVESPEVLGRLGLQFRPADGWRLFAAFSSGAWSGAQVQDGVSATSTTPEQFTFDGVLFSNESITSDLELLNADLGVMTTLQTFDPGGFELGGGVSWWKGELEIESVTTPGKRAREVTESGAPWVGCRVFMPELGVGHMEFVFRFGLLWAGDNNTYQFTTTLHLWYGIGVQLGPVQISARIEYRWWETHRHANSQDEVFGVSLLAPTVALALRF